MDEAVADLHYIAEYAKYVREQLLAGQKPIIGYLNRMAELAEKVQRQFNPNEECCNAKTRR